MDEIIRELKQKHRRLLATIIGDRIFIWRPLGRKQYREILNNSIDEAELDENVCQGAVVYPEFDFKLGAAGFSATLAPIIKEESGYGSPDKVYKAMDLYRMEMQHFEFQAEATIATAFPQIRFEQMEGWTTDELMWHLARAEWALKNIHGRNIDFKPNEEPEEISPEEQVRQLREQGIDPMSTVNPNRLRPRFTEFPFIAGTQLMKNEVIWNGVRQQIPGLSEWRTAIPERPPESDTDS
jgi:hypothetical protein